MRVISNFQKRLIKSMILLGLVLAPLSVKAQHGWTVGAYQNNMDVYATVYLDGILMTSGSLGAFVGADCRGYLDAPLFHPIYSTTYFQLTIGSNESSGETITFIYYDGVDYYDVTETIDFFLNTSVGSAAIPETWYVNSPDIIDPTSTSCPTDIVQTTDAGVYGAVVTYSTPLFSDNVDGSNLTGDRTSGFASGATFPVGVTIVTYEYTDAAGNGPATCTFTVTVTDNEDPTISIANVTVGSDAGVCTASGVALGTPTVSDNCTVGSPTNNAPAVFPLGTTVVTWTVVDGAGNTASASQNVLVEDDESPNVTTCANDQTLSADGNLESTVPNLVGEVVATDNCDVSLTIVQSPTAGTTIGLGITEVTLTVTDDAGNTETCTADMTVVDDQVPVITTCASDRTLSASASCGSTVPDLTGEVVATDNGSIVITQSPTAGTAIGLGTTTVTLTATDGASNSVNCTAEMTVIDDLDPVITAPAGMTVSSDAGVCTASGVALGTPTVSDNCTVGSPTNNAPAVFPLGTTVVTWTVADGAGNTASASQNVLVEDNESPNITTCANDQTLSANGNLESTVPNLVSEIVANDNCDVSLTIVQSPTAGTTIGLGITEVTITVTDDAGNTETCTADMTVVDDQVPVITTCASDRTLSANASCGSTVPDLTGEVVATDNGSIVITQSPAAGTAIGLGTTTVTLTVTDDSDNSVSCTADVEVIDDTNPTITAPTDVNVSSDAGVCTASGVTLGSPVYNDNCSGSSVGNNAPAIYPLGSTTVVWTVTDGAGNTATANQTVIVTDDEEPVISTCASDKSLSANGNLESSVPNLVGEVVASDNCDVSLTITQSPLAGTTIGLGTTVVTISVEDDAGNVTTCTVNIVVADDSTPVIVSCASDKTQSADGTCGSIVPNLIGEFIVTDNGTLTLTQSPTAGTSIGLGVTTVTLTAVDGSGNSVSCSADVTVIDDTNPTITAPADVNVSSDAGVCTASGVTLGSPVYNDNCSGSSVGNNAPAIYPLGSTTVVWTVTDGAGNTATANQTVIVTDDEEPVISTCASDKSLSADGNLEALVPNLIGEVSASDNCDASLTITQSPLAGTTIGLGTTVVTISVEDDAGNITTCTVNVVVADDSTPVIVSCASDKTQSADGTCGSTVPNLIGEFIVTDNGTLTLTQSPTAGTSIGLGVTSVTLTAVDGSGNSVSCTADVEVIDDTNPTITAPTDVNVSSDAGVCTASGVTLGSPILADNCGVPSATHNAPATFPLGNTAVTWIVTDGAGNTSEAIQIVSVLDDEDPVISTCAGNRILSANVDCGSLVPDFSSEIIASDNCDASLSITQMPLAGTIISLGTTPVIISVADDAGNVTTCTAYVTVNDNTNPTILAPADVTVSADAGACTAASVSLGAPTVADNCSIGSTISNAPGVYSLGETTVTWIVTDLSGNLATAQQTVTVVDNEIPVIMTGATDKILSANAACGNTVPDLRGEIVASDNCDASLTITQSPAIGSALGLGTTIVTISVTDDAGNVATSTSDVTVIDDTSPTISAPVDLLVNSAAGVCNSGTVELGTATAEDNCSVASVGNDAPSVFPIGSTTVTWTVTDGSGNTNTASQLVVVSDDEDPTIVAPGALTVSSDAGSCTANSVNLGSATVSDNCSVASTVNDAPASFSLGSTSVTWTVTDGSGNTATASQIVTVEDNENPSITAPADIIRGADAGECTAASVLLGTAVTADNCSVASVANNAPSVFTAGSTTVTWTVTDGSGNTKTASQTVTVIDNENPVIITYPTDKTQVADGNNESVIPNLSAEVVATDNCDATLLVTQSPTSGTVVGKGTTTVTITIADDAGNTTTCTADVMVVDASSPIITTCATDKILSADVLCGTVVPDLTGEVEATDNGTLTIIQAPEAGTSIALGLTTVVLTVTDDASNSTTCTAVLTVVDDTDPTILAPDDIITSADAGVCLASSVNLGSPITTDNCSVLSSSNNAPTTFPSGETIVIWTVTDGSGNTNTAEQKVTIVDMEEPVIVTCAGARTINADGNLEAIVPDLTGEIIATDNCDPSLLVSQSPLVGSTIGIGTTIVTITVSDDAGNSSHCTAEILVSDASAPVIVTCASNKTLSADVDCGSTVPDLTGEVVATDNGTLTIVQSPLAGANIGIGVTEVVITVIDDASNSTSCSANVSVVDDIDPTISAPGALTVNSDAGTCTANSVVLGTANVDDNCSVASTLNNAPASFPLGETIVTWTVTDGAGNTATASQIVTVEDDQDPSITAPLDILTGADGGVCFAASVVLGTAVTSDNCSVASVTNDAPSVFAAGTTTVIWTVTDGSGNTKTASQTVTVTDDEAAIITTYPTDKTQVADGNNESVIPNLTAEVVATDNCDVSLQITQSPTAGTVVGKGTTTVTISITDDAGNVTTCTADVMVVDASSPIITKCAADKTISADALCGSTIPDLTGEVEATDNGNLVITQSPVAGTAIGLGATTVTITVTDDASNSTTCTALVTVVDDTDPTISVPGDVTVNADAGVCSASSVVLGSAIATDNCSVASVGNDAPTIFPLGATTVTWTVADGSGNTAIATQIVTVTDDENPTITAPIDVSVGSDMGVCTASTVALGTATRADNCSVASTTNDAPGTFALGVTTVTWTVTDGSGNTSTDTQLVTVTDDEAPVIETCANDKIQGADSNMESTVPDMISEIIASDNCSSTLIISQIPLAGTTIAMGDTEVTITVSDDAGNSSDCIVKVSVVDASNPIITTCADDRVLSADIACGTIVPDLTSEIVAIDNGTIVITQSPEAGSALGLGATTVVITVTDDAFNTTDCSAIITVIDDIDPAITAPSDVLVGSDVGICEASSVVLGAAVTSDNCSVANIVNNAPETFPAGNTTVMWIVTDGSGNIATAMQTVTVVDDELPVITDCAADVVISADENNEALIPELIGEVVASDNCDDDLSVSQDPAAGTIVGPGDATITFTVTDAALNSTSCTSIVSVRADTTSINNSFTDTDLGFFIYPNPVSYRLRLSNKSGDYSSLLLSVIDVSGKVLIQERREHFGVDGVEIDVSGIKPGFYFVSVKNVSGYRVVLPFEKIR